MTTSSENSMCFSLPNIKVRTSKDSNTSVIDKLLFLACQVERSNNDAVSDSSDDHTRQRCQYFCHKKVGSLFKFRCRCGGVYCKVHQFPEDHACTYDYKADERDHFLKENPTCKADKLKDRI
ncbi:uncharacterized protein [Rutidosis leptorrhynchoides]|uniref:uncharacterized protein n=1 Tax=Rutidosis leptorrhynchoides TaxID=125765 RepID=UPI003A9A15B1